jgi:hypothetical protein
MSAYRFVTLTCDKCFEIFDGGTDRTVKDAREHAASQGWSHPSRSQDLCPICSGTHVRSGEFTLLRVK